MLPVPNSPFFHTSVLCLSFLIHGLKPDQIEHLPVSKFSVMQCRKNINFEKLILKMVLEVWCEQRQCDQEAAANNHCQIQQMGQRRIIKAHWENTVAKVLLHAGGMESPGRGPSASSWNNEW